MNYLECFATRPQLAPVLASLPENPERVLVTDQYIAATTGIQATRHRIATITTRRNELAAEMARATTQRQTDAVIAEQTALTAEIALLPGVLKLQAEALAETLIRWQRIAMTDLNRARDLVADELDRLYDQRAPHNRTMWKASESVRMANHVSADVKAARAMFDSTDGPMKEYQARLAALDQAIAFVRISISTAFGEPARERAPREGEVSRFVKRITTLPTAA